MTDQPPQDESDLSEEPRPGIISRIISGVKNGLISLLGLVFIIMIAAGPLWYYSELHRPGVLGEDQRIIIPEGAGRVVISARVNSAGIRHSVWVYRLEEWRRGEDYRPKAGEFALPEGTSLDQALSIIHKGDSIQHAFTIPPGQTAAEFILALNSDRRFSGVVTPLPSEGDLMPETYFFTRGTDRNRFINRVTGSRDVALASLWSERQADLPYKTLDEAVVMASIIEKETALAEERGLVASVFINRLRKGMKLQSDPTVLYGLVQDGQPVKILKRRHLDHNSPWNTYRNKGLPPTPICNPGYDSLKAALNPEDSLYFYFVADGKGGHAFARTLTEHNRNVKAWRAIRDQAGGDAGSQ